MTDRPLSPTAARAARLLLWSACALALGLRLALWAHRPGSLWFEEDVPVAWAWKLWGWGGRGFDPNPHSAIWPHFSVYVFLCVQAVQFAAGFVTGAWRSGADWNAAMTLDPAALRGGAMLAEIAIGMATLVASARLARRFAGEFGAAGVAFVLAVDPLFVRHSLAVSPDMLLTLFVVLGLHAALDVIERGRLCDSVLAGVWLGLGTASKYSPLLLAVPVVLAHAHRPGGRRGVAVLADARLWLAGAVSLAAFAAGTPFTLVDLVSRSREFALGVSVLGPGPTGNVRVHAGSQLFGRILPGDLGLPLLGLLALAAAWALVRRTPARVALVAFAAVYLAVFSWVPTAFERYLMPAYPPALALAAGALAALADSASRVRRAAFALALVAAFAGLGACAVRFADLFFRDDTRWLAAQWVCTHVPNDALVLTEQAGPMLPDRMARRTAAVVPGVSPRGRAALQAGPAYAVQFLPLSFPDPEISTPMYGLPEALDFDWVVTSTGVRARYLAEAARFPVQVAFYEGLDRFGERVYRTPAESGTGPEITIHRLTGASRTAAQAWWAARVPHPPGFRNARDRAYAAGLWRERALFFERATRNEAASRAWALALAGPGAPLSWRLQYARFLATAGR